LADTASIPASPYVKYQHLGQIVFNTETNTSIQIDCFANNIIKMGGRYYMVSQDLLIMAKVMCEMAQEQEEKR